MQKPEKNWGPNEIHKSEMEKREFKYVMLPNKMKCLLIFDPDAMESAASLEVKIGSFLDPIETRGIANYL